MGDNKIKYIIRKTKDKNFTQMSNDPIYDKNISGNAFRLLFYMLSKPDDWKFKYNQMAKELDVSLETLKRRIKELKDAGYIRTTPTRKQDGSFGGWIIYVYEQP